MILFQKKKIYIYIYFFFFGGGGGGFSPGLDIEYEKNFIGGAM